MKQMNVRAEAALLEVARRRRKPQRKASEVEKVDT